MAKTETIFVAKNIIDLSHFMDEVKAKAINPAEEDILEATVDAVAEEDQMVVVEARTSKMVMFPRK